MGALRRRIEVATRRLDDGRGEARAVVEDDFHHFRVTVRQAGGRVVEAFSQPLRSPTVLCPSAGERLSEILGMPLSLASAAVLERTDARQQCTHMIDLAGLGVAALAAGRPRRRYEAIVPDRTEDRTRAVLLRDGVETLVWDVDGRAILGPAPYVGVNIDRGFTQWARGLDVDTAEAALVLRRAIFISSGRGFDLDAPERRGIGPMGGCWVWQPERAPFATRNLGSTEDFTNRPEVLTSVDQDWLAFSE